MTSSPAAALVPQAAALSPQAAARACFNVQCKEPRAGTAARRRGWRLRSGEPAYLCDRCFSPYEQGIFCETFHADAAGWCKCESCSKRLHCGCIVSLHTYVFLDAGGVECVRCARKSLLMAPNQMWSSASLSPAQASDRPKDLPVKCLNPMTTYPRQVHRIWNLASTQSDLNRRLAYEFDRPNGNDRLMYGIHSMLRPEKKLDGSSERMYQSSLNPTLRNKYANGGTNMDSVPTLDKFHKEEGIADGIQGSGNLGEIDPVSIRKSASSKLCSTSSSGVNFDSYLNTHPNTSLPSSIVRDDTSSQRIGLAEWFPLSKDAHDPPRVSASQSQGETSAMAKQLCTDPQNVVDSESQAQMRNGRPRMDSRARNHLLPRYWPRSTDQELLQISGDSNSIITPLFEKMLSASDAGRVGRLVLPKKCAEVYFPSISQPEGLPLKVLDAKGNEWVFQFRFWPNNNSRMYVLEGVTPCIQSMQLQAGDIVTFSRIDPEGKLVMGFRKAETILADQDNEVIKGGTNVLTPPEANNQSSTPATTSLPPRLVKGSTESQSSIIAEDHASLSKIDQARFLQNDGPSKKSSPVPNRRKGYALGPKSKRLRIENEDSIELKLTWQEAQELLRPPPNQLSSIVVIEGHEVEEYVEAPVLGMPTIFVTNQAGEAHQWAQCESCSKWRKLPEDALLTFRWTCSDNKWDPERSSCTAPQELSKAQLADILPTNTDASKRSKAKVKTEAAEVLEGLDALANLAILGEGESLPSSSQPTTKHPRHRPGCTCIVCIQPPSGKGPKHRQTCTCNVCLTVKRRFRTLMLRREIRQSEKEAETARKQQQLTQPPSQFLPQVVDEESERRTASSSSSLSPLKNQIDLNSQPEREEEPSQTRNAINTSKREWLPKLEAEGETLG